MIRTGYEKEGVVTFPENASPLEVIATVKHLNGSYLAAAKMYLECVEQTEAVKQAVNLISLCIKIEEQAVQYAFKNNI